MNISSSKPPENQGVNRNAQNAQNVQKPASTDQKDQAAAVKKPASGDRVNISDRSKELADIMAAVNQVPEVRDQKVQEIKKSVEAGTYTVDPRRVAESILKSI